MLNLKQILLLVISTILIQAQDSTGIIQQLDEHTCKIGEIIFSKADNSVRVPAEINMDTGLIEVLLCGLNGKTHESLFMTKCKPIHLQIALLSLGYNCMNRIDSTMATNDPDKFRIEVKWSDFVSENIISVEELVYNSKEKTNMKPVEWIFIGSSITTEGHLAAELDQTLIATYSMPCILENGASTKYDDTIFFVNTENVPPKGTKVTLIIRPIEAE